LREQSKPQTPAANRIAPPDSHTLPDPHTPLPEQHAAAPQTSPPDPAAELLDPHSSPSGLASKPPNE